MGNLLLATIFLKMYLGVVIIFTVAFTIYLILKKDINSDIKEVWFCGFKCVGYSLLGLLIYRHYIKLDSIPVLDFFTFTLAIFEGGHSFLNSFGIAIAAGFKVLLKID